jgi:hypothetical protein
MSANASSSLPGLLPTPRATDGTKGGPNQRGSSGDLMLPSAVARLLPTPDATHGRKTTRTGQLLAGVVELLPTPRASPNENRQTARTPSQEAGTHGLSLAAEACLIERERERAIP